MTGQRIGFTDASYPIDQLNALLCDVLPARLAARSDDRRERWTPRKLVLAALMMNWFPAVAMKDRLASVAATLTALFPGHRRIGATYEGFIAALVRQSVGLLTLLLAAWRAAVGKSATMNGWTLIGVDGTKINMPRTVVNESAFGCAGKPGSGPQMLLTMLVHLNTWLPWNWRRGPGTDSERAHLKEMIPSLPPDAMLLADALYTSYELLRELTLKPCAFIIRAGGNVKLLKHLDMRARELDDTVYLWPLDQQKKDQPPLVLRLIKITDQRGRTWNLLTNVTDPSRLSDQDAAAMYKKRWGIEVLHRSLKQTLGRGVLRSRCPRHAKVELDWNVASLGMLAMIGMTTGGDPSRRSAA